MDVMIPSVSGAARWTDHKRRSDWLALVVLTVLCFGVAGLGGLTTTPNIPNWYAGLVKPNWTPPDWVFRPGVVGTLP